MGIGKPILEAKYTINIILGDVNIEGPDFYYSELAGLEGLQCNYREDSKEYSNLLYKCRRIASTIHSMEEVRNDNEISDKERR